ncbi:MAG: tetratricopeptide repeat protein [Bacteroidota bacterium]
MKELLNAVHLNVYSTPLFSGKGKVKKRLIQYFFTLFFILGNLFYSAHSNSINAQSISSLDSLQNLLKVSKEDTSKVTVLNALFAEIRKTAPEKSLEYAERAFRLSQKLPYKLGMAKSLSNIAFYHMVNNNFEKAAEYNLQLLKIYQELRNRTEIINIKTGIGNIYRSQRNYDKAIEFYLSALELSEGNTSAVPEKQTENKKQQAKLLYSIGKIYQNQNNYDGSLKYFFRALRIYSDLNEEKGMADLSLAIGIVYYDRSNNDKTQTFVFKGAHKEAHEYVQKAKKLYQNIDNKHGLISANNHLAYISAGQGEFGKAVEYGLEGLEIAKQMNNKEMEASLNGTIGDVYHAQGNYTKALEYLDKCYEGAKAVNNNGYIRDIYLSYATIYSKLKDYKKAYEYHTRYSDMKEELLKEQSSKQITEISAKYDSEKKDKELIKKDAEIAQQQAETQRQYIQRNALIISFVLLLALAFYIYRGYRNKKKANISITAQKEELERSYMNIAILSEIEQEITSSLSVEKIIEKVYENVNKLMIADVFCIGIHNKKNNSIDFPSFIEKGKKYNSSYNLDDPTRLPILCFNTGREILINDLEKEFRTFIPVAEIPQPLAGERPEALIFLPLYYKKKIIGVINVESFEKNSYTKYHVDILKNLAVYVAIALENAQLYENLEEKVKERTIEVTKQSEAIEKSLENTKLLSNIGREITSVLSVEEIINKVYENVNKLMDASAFGIGVLNKAGNRLNFSGFIEKGEKLPFFYHEIKDETRPAVWSFKNQKEFVINDLSKEYNNYFPDREIPVPKAGEQTESIIYLPLLTSDKVVGVITVQSFNKNAYTEYQLNILRNLAVYVVNGLENARLYENLEEKVKLRTLEIEKQKDELARLSIVASETDNGVLIFDANGEIEWVNAAFTRLQGYDLTDLKKKGNTIEKISDNPDIERLVRECIQNKKSSIYQALNVTKAGKEIWLQSSLTPILDEKENIIRWVVIDIDVTDRKRAEDNIRLQNEKITDSINYAKRIQETLLPPIEEIKKHLPESFILYKPKDIVSGDFYWIYEDKERVIVAVVDCTGHGVPGAFMSLMGNNLLNDIVKVKGKFVPSDILDELNIQILTTLNQNSKNTTAKYGMDIALISLEQGEMGLNDKNEEAVLSNPTSGENTRTSYKLQYAGAHSPLLIYRNKECITIKANKRSIGSYKKDEEEGFTNHVFELIKGDVLYMFSDGYADQIGGPENKKIFAQPFRDLLQSVHQREMLEQKEILDETLNNWQGVHDQTDDVLVMGISI